MQVDPGPGGYSYDIAGEFAAAMADMAVRPGARIAIAVSGGPDSMALAVLLAAWARANGNPVHALTVDHRLRDAAADEARQVERWVSALGFPHVTLVWGEGPAYRGRSASVQSAAREARYRLMTEWCAANGCSHLFLAHHADDQAETFLMRLARGSGVDGLAAMAPVTERGGISLARPLLSLPKARLIAYLEGIGQPWIEDPSNVDGSYGRVRMRAAREVLAREGLTAERLLKTAGHMRRARAALDFYTRVLLGEACAWDAAGVGRLALPSFLAAPEEVALRALAQVLMIASGQVYRPRFERLLRLYESLRAGPWRDATLHGCILARDGAALVIAREAAQIEDEMIVPAGETVIWDRRFEVQASGRQFRLRRLRLADVSASLRACTGWAAVPAFARESLPALFDSQGLAAVPAMNFVRADLAALPSVSVTAAFICPRIDQIAEDDAEL